MSQFPKDDRELISFLQQYRPLPPPANSTLEKQLYARVSHEPQQHQVSQVRWLIPSMIAASLLAIWGGYNVLEQSPYQQFVQQSQEIETAELEDFMVNSWQGTINTSPLENQYQPVYYQWISLDNLEPQYLVSNP
ncbi:MAG: hypothetical protein WBM32_00505 [Crocosphaera sp.]|jgi:hypothetical protein